MSVVIPSLRGAIAVPGWAKNELWRRAKAVPSLDLRFAENRSLVDATTGLNLITFSRTSDATFVGSNGLIQTASAGTPRFDHNPTTGESLGLLVEEQRTNLLLQSADFTTTWTASALTVSTNAIVSPDGSTNGDKLQETAVTAEHYVRQFLTGLSTNTTYTISVFVKAAERTKFRIRALDTDTPANGYVANFDLSAITASGFGAGAGSITGTPSITPVGNGWFRCVVSGNAVTGTKYIVDFFTLNAAGASSYLGVVGEGLFIWGAQLEAGAFPTSYIPTGASAVTRAADACSISGSNFSSWYRQDEGTMFMEANTFFTGSTGRDWWRLSDGTVNNIIRLSRSGLGATPQLLVSAAGAGQGAPFSFSIAANTFFKNVCYFNTDDLGITTNGSPLAGSAVDTLATIPTEIDRFELSAAAVNCHYKRLTFWPQRLPSAIAQSITQ